jgi:pyridoxamine 5'-phosphate oxidase family protein
MVLTPAEERFLARQSLGHLATIAPSGKPQVKPVGFSYNRSLGTLDITGFNMAESAKYRNVQTNPSVSFVIDEITEAGMNGAHFLEIRGVGETVIGTHDPDGHLAAEIIRIHPQRIVGFNVDPDRPGFQARNLLSDRDGNEAA